MTELVKIINDFINHPDYRGILAILKGFRNGLVYGVKVRFPHALVMTALFRTGSLKDKAWFIFEATKTHAKNLSLFVLIYKTLMYLQYRSNGYKEGSSHSFLAGLIGGYLIFGKENNINKQIVLYLFSRVMLGLVQLPAKRKIISQQESYYPLFAALNWGLVMWLFRHDPDVLQPSLRASMQYLYVDSNYWTNLKTLLWHNK